MAQDKQVQDHARSQTSDADEAKKGVVNMATYKPTDAGAAAFKQVMSQMNIADRNAFDKQFSQQWNDASANNELLSVLVCEIDYFKEYHDNYGQQGASFMLLVIALALKNICEQNDYFLAQYDKEEFAILIKGSDQQQVAEVAESLRQAVEASRTEHKFSAISKIVTLSIGISSIYPKSMQMLMKATNAALATAKQAGRNQVAGDFPESEEIEIAQQAQIAQSKALALEEQQQQLLAARAQQEPAIDMDNIPEPEAEKTLTIEADEPPAAKKRGMFTLDLDDFFSPEKNPKIQTKPKPKKSKFKGSIDIDGGMY